MKAETETYPNQIRILIGPRCLSRPLTTTIDAMDVDDPTPIPEEIITDLMDVDVDVSLLISD